MPTLLTIAGFDPSSGAGVTADLMVFAAHGCFGISCITALTVQSTTGVRDVVPVAHEVVRSTLECLQDDLPAAGVKVGMLGNASTVRTVAAFLSERRTDKERIPVVVDPVLRSSSGADLLTADSLDLFRSKLLPVADWITPNLEELGVLTGRRSLARADVIAAARELQAGAPGLNVLVTGGHMDPPDDLVLPVDREPVWIEGHRVKSRSTHGTGCVFSSALLARLVLGDAGPTAARAAKAYVERGIAEAPGVGAGCGPLNHLWPRPLAWKDNFLNFR